MGEGTMPPERDERREENYTRTHRREQTIEEETAKTITGGSTLEIIAGAGAVVLGILGLADVLPTLFVIISIIAVGGGLMLAGGSIAAKYRDLLGSSERRSSSTLAETGGGITAETIGGAAGVALGILALVGIEPATLMSVAIIVLGGALMFGAGATRRLSNVLVETSRAPMHKQRVANESVKGAAAMQVIAGLAAAALGILTLVDIGGQVTLSLVAVIILGGGLLLSGLAVGGKMVNMLYRNNDRGRGYEGREVREYRHDPEHRSAE
jgi:hypothetical protein